MKTAAALCIFTAGALLSSRQRTPDIGAGEILFIGDSLTSGHGLAAGVLTYPDILGKTWNRKVHKISRSGMTAAALNEKLGSLIDELDLNETSEIAAIFVAIGANDQLRGGSPRDLTESLKAIRSHLYRFDAPVFFVQCVIPLKGNFYSVYKNAAKEAGTPLSSDIISAYWFFLEGRGEDGIHPSEKGHFKIAEALDEDYGDIMRADTVDASISSDTRAFVLSPSSTYHLIRPTACLRTVCFPVAGALRLSSSETAAAAGQSPDI